MKREKNRILLTLKEAEQIEDCLNTLNGMAGVYDQEFNKDCHAAEKMATKLWKLRNQKYVDEPIDERLTLREIGAIYSLYRCFIVGGTPNGLKIAEALKNIFGNKVCSE